MQIRPWGSAPLCVCLIALTALLAKGDESKATIPAFDLKTTPRVVLVCSTRGGMIDKFTAAKAEIHALLTSLQKTQLFNVMTYADEKADSMTKDATLIRATPESIASAEQFLAGQAPTGTGKGLAAILDIALKPNPQAIVLICGDSCDDFDEVLKHVEEIKKKKKAVKIHVLLLDKDDIGAGVRKEFKDLTDVAGGSLKVVKVD